MRPTHAPDEIRIRPVTLGDAASVARIYNHYVADTIVTFEKVAHFRENGLKFDRWIDVGYWQLML